MKTIIYNLLQKAISKWRRLCEGEQIVKKKCYTIQKQSVKKRKIHQHVSEATKPMLVLYIHLPCS